MAWQYGGWDKDARTGYCKQLGLDIYEKNSVVHWWQNFILFYIWKAGGSG